MNKPYRINAFRETEGREIEINQVRTLGEAMKLARGQSKDPEEAAKVKELLDDGYTMRVYRNQPSLVHEVRR